MSTQHRARWSAVFLTTSVLILFVFVFWIQHEQNRVIKERRAEIAITQAMNRADTALITLNQAGIIMVVTPEVCRLSGYTEEELVGSTPDKLIPNGYKKAHTQGFTAAIDAQANRQHEIWCLLRTKSGRNIPVRNYVYAYPEGALAIITPAQLPEVETGLYRMALDASNIGVWWWELGTNRLNWDQRMYQLYDKVEPEEPTYDLFRASVFAEDLVWLQPVVDRCIQVKGQYRAVFRIHAGPTGTKYILALGKVYDTVSGSVFVGVCTEVPEGSYTGREE